MRKRVKVRKEKWDPKVTYKASDEFQDFDIDDIVIDFSKATKSAYKKAVKAKLYKKYKGDGGKQLF